MDLGHVSRHDFVPAQRVELTMDRQRRIVREVLFPAAVLALLAFAPVWMPGSGSLRSSLLIASLVTFLATRSLPVLFVAAAVGLSVAWGAVV